MEIQQVTLFLSSVDKDTVTYIERRHGAKPPRIFSPVLIQKSALGAKPPGEIIVTIAPGHPTDRHIAASADVVKR